MKGFTLIELIIVIAVSAVLSVIGIAAFVTYSRAQVLTAATQDVATMLQVAKSRAQSQVKPDAGACATSTLDGYKVVITATNIYKLVAVCGSNDSPITDQEKTLRNATFSDSSVGRFFFFRVLSGSFEGASEAVISAYEKSKAITVSSSGIIQVVNR